MNENKLKLWDFIIDKSIATGDRIRKRLSINEFNFKTRVSCVNPQDAVGKSRISNKF